MVEIERQLSRLEGPEGIEMAGEFLIDNRLEGTINIVLKRAVNRRIWLDKIGTKAGDIK